VKVPKRKAPPVPKPSKRLNKRAFLILWLQRRRRKRQAGGSATVLGTTDGNALVTSDGYEIEITP
jgi:hypothetical protein